MTCVLRVPVEHIQDWPDTPQQLFHQIQAALGETPRMQFSDWKDYAEFWVSEKNAVLAKAARDGVCLTVSVARNRQEYRYALYTLDTPLVPRHLVAYKPDARVLLL